MQDRTVSEKGRKVLQLEAELQAKKDVIKTLQLEAKQLESEAEVLKGELLIELDTRGTRIFKNGKVAVERCLGVPAVKLAASFNEKTLKFEGTKINQQFIRPKEELNRVEVCNFLKGGNGLPWAELEQVPYINVIELVAVAERASAEAM